ncbi:MAG: ankyrin repeat domain-containing protein, partial [Vicinamibacteria bacterium]
MRRTAVLLGPALLWSVVASGESLADAASSGDLEQVRMLLEQGADVNLALGDGMTALHCAARNGNLAIAEDLIRAGAN